MKRLISQLTVLEAAAFLICLSYALFFWLDLAPFWFDPGWTTDDALQQIYPFHKVNDPELFKGDLITKMMECYLAPLHYWLCYFVTWVVGDPIMMGHWVHLIQLLLSISFVFLCLRKFASLPAAFFGVAWLLHTRHIMQRLTAGLPRGWALPVLTGYLYLVATKRYGAVLVLILAGCLLHPPSTLLIALCHGLYLTWNYLAPSSRSEYRKHFWTYVLLSPVFALVAFSVTQMPPEIGKIASSAQELSRPEFSRPDGRFPFLPLRPAFEEIKSFGFQAFRINFYNPGKFWRESTWWLVCVSFLLVGAIGLKRRRNPLPRALICYILAAATIYFLSRHLIFRLYVPDRHLQFPLAVFFIIGFTTLVWRSLHGLGSSVQDCGSSSWRSARVSGLGLLVLGALIYAGSGSGLQGTANFNYSPNKRGGAWSWMQQKTPPDSLVAGHPTLIDSVQLFGKRQGYVTTETAHPFYDVYYEEMERRLIISLKAHYARSFQELVNLVDSEGIDYFAFDVRLFTPEALASAKYFEPITPMVKQLASFPPDTYLFSKLPPRVNMERFPPLVFRDDHAAVVSIARLKKWLSEYGETVIPMASALPIKMGKIEDFSIRRESL